VALAMLAVVASLVLAGAGSARAHSAATNGLIAFQVYGDKSNATDGIYLVNPDGSGLHRLANQLPDSGEPRWSPDGRELLLLSVRSAAQSVYVIRPDGTSRRALLRGQPPGRVPGYASWSPDGRKIAVARGRPCARIVCDASLYVFSIADRKIRKVASHVSGISPPSWSPDGRRIAYTSARDGRLYLTTVGGHSVRLFIQKPGLMAHPSWTPDGRTLAFTLFGNRTRSYVIDADGRSLHPVLRTGDATPEWSPDGRRLVFSRGSASGDIFVANSDGSHVDRVTRDPRDETLPNWQPLR
jgi:TolB protein